jgi:hypothetical protein
MIRFIVLGGFLLIAGLSFPYSLLATTYTVDIYATVPGCGDTLIQSGETCDGTNLGGATCESVGFDEGTLSCSSVCTLITTSCAMSEDEPSGGTRTGSGVRDTAVTDTNVIVSGVALSGMSVSLLKDGQRVATIPARDNGTFMITLTGLATGVYKMQIVGLIGYSQSVRSEVFEVRVIKNSTTKISGITLPPSLTTTQDATGVLVSGFTFPNTAVQLTVDGVQTALTVSDETGLYKFILPKQSSLKDTTITVSTMHSGVPVSSTISLLRASAEPALAPGCQARTDSNGDCQVDVVDFFVMRWRFLSGMLALRFDFNNDGSVSIVDFSIMAYYWTG